MDLKAVEKVVGKIQSTLFKNSNSYATGMLRSHFRGSGLQFKEHQIYVPGDDVKFIDWKLLAKTNTPYIKTFDEERNVEIVTVLDVSPSMFTGSNGVSKITASLEICSLLCLLAKETHDKVQIIIIGEKIVSLPKKAGKEAIVDLVAALTKMGIMTKDGEVDYNYRPQEHADENEKMVMIKKYLAKKREVVLLSDFQDFIPVDKMKTLLANKNLHCFKMTCPLDEAKSFPFSVYAHYWDGDKFKSRTTCINGRSDDDELKKMFGKKFKKIHVESRYLEDFIKEMI